MKLKISFFLFIALSVANLTVGFEKCDSDLSYFESSLRKHEEWAVKCKLL